MKEKKLVIHLAKHLPTGAEIPVLVNKTDENNVVTDYKEFMDNRRGFTLYMLQNRWGLCVDGVTQMLQKYQVPGHINHAEVRKGKQPMDVAIFFEEYIYGLEKKEKLKHSKLKSRKVTESKGP